MEVYLDNSATTIPMKEVVEIINKALTMYYGNPSSLHSKGVEIERLIKASRRKVAKAIGAEENEVFFTSGGTESNNIAILGAIEANRRRGNHIITTKIEHPSVLNVFKYLEEKGYKVTYLAVDSSGRISVDELINSLQEDTILVSIMYINNETGVVQPIDEIQKLLKKNNSKALLHVDAIQAFGKADIYLKKSNIDLLTISGHKFHGPKGIGALYVKKGTKIQSIVYGGNQENGLRSGTENVPGILGLGEAAELTKKNMDIHIKKMHSIKAKLYYGIENNIANVIFNSHLNESFSSHILNVSFLGIRGEVLLHTLEQRGIFVSTGSACSSKKKAFSHVLTEIGLSNDEMEGAIRFSFNPFITDEEIDYTLENLIACVEELRKVINRR